MKNLMSITTLLLIAFLIPSITFGQTNSKGDFFIGAELASNASDRILDLNMTPRFGYFVSDKFVLGFASNRQVLSMARFSISDMEIFARYYLPIDLSKKENVWKRFTFFGEVGTKAISPINFREIEDINLNLRTHIGTNIKMNDKLSLEIALTPDLFNGISLDLDPRVGLEYRFKSKKK